MTQISFPGLGIGPFTVDSTAFAIGNFEIKWYGIIICLGMILAYTYAWTRAKYEGIKTDDLIDLALVLLICGIAGARIYYIIFELDSYIVKGTGLFDSIWKSFLRMVNIHNGGLAIYGGIIAGAISAYVFARKKKIHFPILADVLAPSVMVGQMIGRWGNFVNAEAHGGFTDLPWRMGIQAYYPGTEILQPGSYGEYHPTFLYESLWNFVGFVIITALYKKKKFNGQWVLFYFAWYGLGRFMIEGLRTDSLYIGSIRVSQLLSALLFAAAAVLLVLGFIRTRKEKAE